MSPDRGLPLERLYPSGKQTVAGMVAKGWIERRPDGYYITTAGLEALRTPIPNKRN
jgi:hypothetical protein